LTPKPIDDRCEAGERKERISMYEESWISKLDRRIALYNRGGYSLRELRDSALAAMPSDGAGELVRHLPKEVVMSLRGLIRDTMQWSDADWESLISIHGPQPSSSERLLFRQKCAALQAHFAAEKCDD
jgi:hypothetical protein